MNYWDILNKLIEQNGLEIDRKKGSSHPKYSHMVYPVDYGFIKNSFSMDGNGIDLFVGEAKDKNINGIMCIADTVKRDSEIKVIYGCSETEIEQIDRFLNSSEFMKAIYLPKETGSCQLNNNLNGTVSMKPIALVTNSRLEPLDDHWSAVESVIELADDLPTECLDGIEQFSHLEIIYHFNRSTQTVTGSEHPRENPGYPKVGIFAQRKKDRPNHIGATIVKLVKHENRNLIVRNLDAIDGTPVLDIKPVFTEYLPQEKVVQPEWTNELMKNYW